MAIWYDPQMSLEKIRNMSHGTMAEYIGIEITELGENYLKGRMPVDHRTCQPFGVLHGGASATLAETLGSIGSFCVLNPELNFCVGLEINANHVRSVSAGFVYGTATPLHLGGSTHIWDIRILNQEEKLVCVGRLTVAVLAKNRN
jgi:1,4-dihydroxy-2-naphthoyl-CoA hydrolase